MDRIAWNYWIYYWVQIPDSERLVLISRSLARQKPLGPEFEAVYDANVKTLYEP